MSDTTRIYLRDIESDVRREDKDIAVDVITCPLGIYIKFVGFDGNPPCGFPFMPPGVMIQNVHGKIEVGVRSNPDEYAHTHVIRVKKSRRRKS